MESGRDEQVAAGTSGDADGGADDRDERRRRRRRLTLLVVPIVGLVIATNVANALFPTLATQQPLLLIALDSRNRNLLAATNEVAAPAFFAVGFFRLVLSDPLFFLLGRWYGDAGVRWMERKLGDAGRWIGWMERWFAKAAYPIVALAPNNIICLLAGATRMRPLAFVALNAGGTVARLVAVWYVGEALANPIDVVLDWIARYRVPLTVGTAALVAIQMLVSRRRGTSEIETVGELEAELADAEAEVEQETTAAEHTGGAARGRRGGDADDPERGGQPNAEQEAEPEAGRDDASRRRR